MSLKIFLFRTLLLTLVLSCFNGCSSNSSSSSSSAYDTSSAEVAAQSVAGAAGASDSGGSVVTLNSSPALEKNPKLMAFQLIDMLFESKAAASACSTSAAVQGAGCVGAVMTLSMGSCSGLVGTWTGTYTLTFSSAGACTNATTSGLMSMGANNSVVLTTTNAGLSVGNYTVSMSSNSSGFSIPESGGIQVTCGAGGCATSRTVSILGVNRILMLGSATLYNHTINSPTPFTISGVGASKQISAGQLQLQHNLAHYIATSTINQTLSFSSGCCLPTAGTMATAFSSGKSGSEAITFSSTCGSASVNGNTVSLNYCM